MIAQLKQVVLNKLVSAFQSALDVDSKNIERCRQRNALMESADFVDKELARIPSFQTQQQLLAHAVSVAIRSGLWTEFGVFSGQTINFIAEHAPGKVYGFDSFEGLPEDWRTGYGKGKFAVSRLPKVRENVTLVKGWFNETLPEFLREHDEKVTLLHVDCDLYSSTRTIFDLLGSRLVDGSVIVFDEYFNYPGWREGEYRALAEYAESTQSRFEYIGYCGHHEQVAIRWLCRGAETRR